MPKGSTAKERVYDQALSLILSLPPEYWVKMRADLDKASASSIPRDYPRIEEISLKG